MAEWNRWPESKRLMGIGILLPIAERGAFGPTSPRVADLLSITLAAESAGIDTVWLPDHFFFRPPVAPEGEEYGMWEAWTTAAALAQGTSAIQIGLLVTCLGWRNPGIVARMTETIEDISNGRFILGVGAGWHEPEYDGYGLPFDHRAGRFDDSITILDQLLRTGRADHAGKFFSARNAINQPRGPRSEKGGPPILVGTDGDRMLRLTAKYADAWNTVWHTDPEEARMAMTNLDMACADVGRDPDSIVRTAGGHISLPGHGFARSDAISGSPADIAAQLARFRDLGFRHFVGWINPCTPASVGEFSAVLDLLDRA